MEKIGVQAVFDDSQFKKGVDEYNRALQAATKNTGSFAESAEKAGAAASKTANPLQSVGGALKAIATSAIVAQIGRTALELATLGVQAEKTNAAFVAISGGTEQARANLQAMRQATQGTISDLDAMAQANRLLQMGLASNSEELGRVAGMAVRLGTAMGRDANTAIEEFALLLANQSIPRLDTFGISAGRVRTRIAELQAATPGLTREQAFLTAVMEEGSAAMERLGDSGLGAIQNTDRLSASFENLKVTLGTALAPALTSASGFLAENVTTLDQLIQIVKYATTNYGYFSGGVMLWQEIFGKNTPLTQDAIRMSEAMAQALAAETQGYRDVGAAAGDAVRVVRDMGDTTRAAIDPALSWSSALMQDVAALGEMKTQQFVILMIRQLEQAQKDGTISSEQLAAAQLALYEQSGLLTEQERQTYLAMQSLTQSFGAGKLEADTFAAAVLSAKGALDAMPKTVEVDFVYNIPALPDFNAGPGRAVPMAAGGARIVTRPTLFMAGERGVGPELITGTPLRGPIDNSRTVTVNLGGATVNAPTDPAALAHTIARQIGRNL